MFSYFRAVIIVVAIVLLGLGGVYYWQNLRGVGPALRQAPEDITQLIPSSATLTQDTQEDKEEIGKNAVNETGMPLKLPARFSISILAKGMGTPRVVAPDAQGNVWVSEMGAGAVTKIEMKDGRAQGQNRIFRNLKRPHGIAFDPADPNMIYIAEENKVSRAPLGTEAGLEKIVDLPAGGRHFSRTIGFGPDGRLYVAIGSSCDVCNEKDERRATIYALNKDGTDFRLFAKGLRNTVFFTWHPVTKEMWGTDMGRDRLGDDLPPDEVNIIRDPSTSSGRAPGAASDYGWPICYGKNVHDTNFDKNTYIRNPCMEPLEIPSHIDLPAHSAPLGIAFIPSNSNWPQEYWGDLLIAYHGSWNRSTPTGYKVVRIRLDAQGAPEGTEDFITGWRVLGGALGRPVDLKFDAQGTLFISDDKAGVIYKVIYASG